MVRQIILIALVVAVLATLGGGVYLRGKIIGGIDEIVATASQENPGTDSLATADPIPLLLALVGNERAAWANRNKAVWALGQLRDARALATLESYHHGAECDHGRDLCQKELKKAIALCSGGKPNLLFIPRPERGSAP